MSAWAMRQLVLCFVFSHQTCFYGKMLRHRQHKHIPSGDLIQLLKMAIIVDLPIKNGDVPYLCQFTRGYIYILLYIYYIIYIWLVVYLPSEHMSPNRWKVTKIHFPNHQPVCHVSENSFQVFSTFPIFWLIHVHSIQC